MNALQKTFLRFTRISKKLSPLIGICLLAYIISKINISKCGAIFSACDLSYMILCALIGPAIIMIMALRWQIILRAVGINYNYWKCSKSLIKGALLGEVTPGRLGELFRAQMVTNETKKSLGSTLFTVIIDRIYDLFILAFYSCAALSFLLLGKGTAVEGMVVVVAAVAIAFATLIILNENIIRQIIKPVTSILLPPKLQKKIELYLDDFYGSLSVMRKKTHVQASVLTLIIWFCKFFAVFILAISLQVNINFGFALSIGVLATAVTLIPISVSGMGTREAVFIALLTLQQKSPEQAVALSFAYFLFGVWSTIIPSAVVFTIEAVVPFINRLRGLS